MKRHKKQAFSQEDGERKAKLSLAQVEIELLTSIINNEIDQLDNTTVIADGYLVARQIGEKLDHVDEINKIIEELKGNTTTARLNEKSNDKCVIKNGGTE